MLDIKYLREHHETAKKLLAGKGVDPQKIDTLLVRDEQYRILLKSVEESKAKQNEVSKKITSLQGAEKEELLKEMKTLSDTKKENEQNLQTLEQELNDLLSDLPNIPFASVPVGKSDEENKVIRTVGEKPKFDFVPKEHWELAENLGLLDMERGAKVAGSRFYYLKNELAVLQMALMNWAFLEIQKKGFCPTIPPFMVRAEAMRGTGFLSKADANEIYAVNPGEDDLYLIGTSEVSLMAYHSDEILDEEMLPVKMAGYSPCFRREAGSYGKDTKGILRVHQFEKIEMVVVCTKEQAEKIHEELRETEEYLLQQLGLPYQVIDICTGDLGFSAAKKYDLEGWLPGQQKYRELTSTSNCTDFQTRRLKIRVRKKDGSTETAYSLNGTAVSSRPLIAIFENFQNEDGSIDIPEVLQKFTGFKRIEAKK
ncbi:MAG: serine--tRNA ligase [Candidatus Peregrinibacteria bacterium]